jgi:hypothetical protein
MTIAQLPIYITCPKCGFTDNYTFIKRVSYADIQYIGRYCINCKYPLRQNIIKLYGYLQDSQKAEVRKMPEMDVFSSGRKAAGR